MKKTDINLIQTISSVEFECPYCGEEIDISYDEFQMVIGDVFECSGEIFDCPNCREGFEIEDYTLD